MLQLSRPAIEQLITEAVATARRATYRSAAEIMTAAGLRPDPWQAHFLTSPAHQIILNCCRQSGKSTSTAALALWTAATKPNALVLCVAPALRQSQELFRKVTDLYEAVPGLPAMHSLSALRAEMDNGSRIIVLPDAERTIRGFSAVTLLVVDEAAGVRDETYYSLRPMLAVARKLDPAAGRLVILSTPRGQRGFFFDVWGAAVPDWFRLQVTADEVDRITPEFLEAERRELGDIWYRQEYFCQFLAPENAVFDYDAIEQAASEEIVSLLDSPYMAGRMPGRTAARYQFYAKG